MSNELSGMTVLSPTGAPMSVIPKNIKPKKTTGDIPGMSVMSESGSPMSVVAKNDKPKDLSMLINTAQQEVQYCPIPDNWSSSVKSPSSKDIQITNTGQQHNDMLFTQKASELKASEEELQTDKRVSLTVRPRVYNTDNDMSLMRRVVDILGSKDEGNNPTETKSDELFNYYSKSFGIIFPYTPKISGLGRTVNYDDVDILYSNMKYKQFKNSTPEKITLNAKFTADTETNAAAMLHAIWFLNACSMCKFGKETGADAGLPPPILYLKAYNNLIDNIPVVITNYSYSLDDKSHYVHFSTESGRGYWLPMICDITIQLDIQPNIKKTYETWTLNKYKSGELFSSLGKNPNGKFIPSGWTW